MRPHRTRRSLDANPAESEGSRDRTRARRIAPMPRSEVRWSRREWLLAAAALPLAACASSPRIGPFARSPFALGLASGDPTASGFVLWTRLCVEAALDDFGVPPVPLDVEWTIAKDRDLRDVVQSGRAVASPEDGHSLHVEVDGLAPDTEYFYAFRHGDHATEVGRAHTTPDGDRSPARTVQRGLRFAVASCQSFEQGLYTAYDAMAQDDLDLVVFLGDYVYEYATNVQGKVRAHLGDECTTLADYRRRYAQYKSDPRLRRMHAQCPWLLVPDDHEVANNYAGPIPAKKEHTRADFRARRTAAYRAYWENMPLRRTARPTGDAMDLFRTVQYGDLIAFHLLDTRQYRTDQPNGDGVQPASDASRSPDGTMLGTRQREWLFDELRRTRTRYHALAQQVVMATVDLRARPGETPRFAMDQWPGYAHERERLLRFLQDEKISNPIVLTGDVHSAWCNDLRIDDRDPHLPVVAPEFVATSISSGGNGYDLPKEWERLALANPFVRFHDGRRGYLRCTVTRDRFVTDFVVMDRVETEGGTAAVRASFVVRDGDPHVERVR